MTLPRNKSRPVDVDGVPYRWMIRETLADGDLFVVMAQGADGAGPRLHAVSTATWSADTTRPVASTER